MEFVNFIKNNGVIGVIAVWVYFLNQDVAKLKLELTDCNKEKIEIMKPFVRPTASTDESEKERPPYHAIMTQPILIKNDEDEKS